MLDNQISIARKLEMPYRDWEDALCKMQRLSITEINELVCHLLAIQAGKARDMETAVAKLNQNP